MARKKAKLLYRHWSCRDHRLFVGTGVVRAPRKGEFYIVNHSSAVRESARDWDDVAFEIARVATQDETICPECGQLRPVIR